MGSHSFIKRGKKADLSINIIVIAVIALLVLVVIIYIFNSQTKKVTGGYTGITDKALAPKCEGFLGENGNCKKTSCDSKEESEVPPKKEDRNTNKKTKLINFMIDILGNLQ